MKKPFKELTALIVDDYESMRKKLSSKVASLGLTVVEAGNGIEAMKILRGEMAGKIDVLFTDIVMPEMDGFELCEEVRKNPDLRGLPIVVSSTHVDASYVVKALRMGADDYIAKPVKGELVKKVLTRIMTPVYADEKDA